VADGALSHKLFESEGVTYSEFVLRERLARAYQQFEKPPPIPAAISTIAFDLGFNDLSYFNRAFRRRYNATHPRLGMASGRNKVASRQARRLAARTSFATRNDLIKRNERDRTQTKTQRNQRS